MERKFTLRIGEAEEEKLVYLKKITGEKTDTGAIKYVFRNFETLNHRYRLEIEKCQRLEKAKIETEQRINIFLSAFDGLKMQ